MKESSFVAMKIHQICNDRKPNRQYILAEIYSFFKITFYFGAEAQRSYLTIWVWKSTENVAHMFLKLCGILSSTTNRVVL